MTLQLTIRAAAVTACLTGLAALCAPIASFAQGADAEEVDRLFEELADPDQPGWQQIEDSIAREWSKSGSPSMDLLLQRGREALEADDTEAAIEHLTALTDHAPDFAEGWNARATAYFRAERYGLALDDIARTLALEPRHFGAMIGFATILRELGQEEDALEMLRLVHELHPHRPNVNEGIEALSARLEGSAL